VELAEKRTLNHCDSRSRRRRAYGYNVLQRLSYCSRFPLFPLMIWTGWHVTGVTSVFPFFVRSSGVERRERSTFRREFAVCSLVHVAWCVWRIRAAHKAMITGR